MIQTRFKILERIKYLLFNIDFTWEIGVKKISNKDPENIDLKRMKWLKQPKNTFWADPFIIIHNNIKYVFFEEFLKKQQYGTIAFLILDNNHNIKEKKTILDTGKHTSFPYVFKFKDKFYILPETVSTKKLSLFEAQNFPYNWVESHTLLNFGCSDPILFFENNFWHLFYCKTDNVKLYARKNNNLFDGWDNCREFEIKNDISSARNAGNIIRHGDKIYRPSQVCTNFYGEKIQINVIDSLSLKNYKESKLLILESSGKKQFNHTISVKSTTLVGDRRIEHITLKPAKEIFKKTYFIAKRILYKEWFKVKSIIS